jgi:1-deoxy-D-xylulose-5-phosphate reductoisomerase
VSTRKRVAVLGSTGSIGRQTLDVASRLPQKIDVVALAARADVEGLATQAGSFPSARLAMADDVAATALESQIGRAVGRGPDAVTDLIGAADVVVNALVGAAGLRATVETLRSGATLALANKESLVVGGELVTGLAQPDQILPVDSEHSAVFQCLVGEDSADVAKVWLTASGGPFRGFSRNRLQEVTAAEALAHPTWRMGPKITIDSATLMNKGLEAIEAHHLFAISFDRIGIVVHPRSCVHSMVEFVDGSVKAHLGVTDMRIPIQYALSYPRRWDAPVEPLDLALLGSLEFEPPDADVFRCLTLALAAGRTGGTMPAAMNAANEVAVAAFLAGECGFLDIESVVEDVMSEHDVERLGSIEQVEAVDDWARTRARSFLEATS